MAMQNAMVQRSKGIKPGHGQTATENAIHAFALLERTPVPITADYWTRTRQRRGAVPPRGLRLSLMLCRRLGQTQEACPIPVYRQSSTVSEGLVAGRSYDL